MADAPKRNDCVRVCFDERMYLDLNREAIKRDVKVSDLIYKICKWWAYGNRIPDPAVGDMPLGGNDDQ